MRILITSDIHNNLDNLFKLREKERYDLHLDAGDSNIEDQALGSLQIVSVKGNTDWGSNLPLNRIIETPLGKILLVHGHIQGVKYMGPEALLGISYETKADIVIFGHTHQKLVKKIDDILFINPGSLGFGNTYAVLSEKGLELKEL